MATVRIYQLSQSAMQSGKGKKDKWKVDFEPRVPLDPEPLMGWIPSQDMNQELDLLFPSLQEALRFVTIKGYKYRICNSTQISTSSNSYEANFTIPRMRG